MAAMFDDRHSYYEFRATSRMAQVENDQPPRSPSAIRSILSV